MLKRARGALLLVIYAGVAVIAGELGARIDDRLFEGIELTANPTFSGLFFNFSDGIRRGVPHARWKKVEFNNLGMRGPDLAVTPKPGCTRWLFLGASETFGEPGIAGADYPSHLRARIAAQPDAACVEIANSSSPGLSVRGVTEQFDAYLHRLHAHVVFVYPDTQVYLTPMRPRRTPSPQDAREPPGALPVPHSGGTRGLDIAQLGESSRLLGRLRDSAEVPEPIQRLRTQRWIDSALAQHGTDWPFTSVPREPIEVLADDLAYLVQRIRASGATPVLIAHAIRSSNPPRQADFDDLFAARTYVPRAPPEVFVGFEYAAAERTRRVAKQLGVQLIDAAAHLSGRRELFIDEVHFTPAGNEAMAALIDRVMRPARR